MIDLSDAGGLVAAAWRADRAYLIDLAYRMLGDIGAAEDVVQEAFLRLDLVEPGVVRDARGWLTVVTSRLCLDRIRSAHNRRERPSDTAWLDSAVSVSQQAMVDPADRVTLDEEVSEALLILLQRLSPAERVCFVLHDVFQLPFDQVAEILGKPSATCRQLAKRARAKVAGSTHTTEREMADHELQKISQTFIAACANGDFQALTAVLHEQVWGVADFTAGDPPQLRPPRSSAQVQRGADRIARSLLRFFGGAVTLVSAPATSGLAFLAFLQRRPYATITASVEGGRLTNLHAVVNQDAVRAANSTTSPARE
jgi:RNA polymerase sigma-70 factor (ECF subfamily)